jgi:hypothetical protein
MSVFGSKNTCAVMCSGCKKLPKQTGNHIYVFYNVMNEHINSENCQFDFNYRMHNGNPHVKCLKSWYVDKKVKSNLFYILVIVSSFSPFICSVSSVPDIVQKTVQDMYTGWDNLQNQKRFSENSHFLLQKKDKSVFLLK